MIQQITRLSLGAFMASAMVHGMAVAADSDDGAPGLAYDTVLSDLDNPWDMAFLPDGTMFFTEKCRGLSVRLPEGDVNPLL